MYFLLMGIVAGVLKYLEMGPFTDWPWWMVLSPFGMAVLWWWWADNSGYTKRKEIEKMDKRSKDRIEKSRAAMGMLSAKKRK